MNSTAHLSIVHAPHVDAMAERARRGRYARELWKTRSRARSTRSTQRVCGATFLLKRKL